MMHKTAPIKNDPALNVKSAEVETPFIYIRNLSLNNFYLVGVYVT